MCFFTVEWFRCPSPSGVCRRLSGKPQPETSATRGEGGRLRPNKTHARRPSFSETVSEMLTRCVVPGVGPGPGEPPPVVQASSAYLQQFIHRGSTGARQPCPLKLERGRRGRGGQPDSDSAQRSLFPSRTVYWNRCVLRRHACREERVWPKQRGLCHGRLRRAQAHARALGTRRGEVGPEERSLFSQMWRSVSWHAARTG